MLGITALIKYILQRYISIGTPLKVKQWGNHMSLADWFSQGNKSKKKLQTVSIYNCSGTLHFVVCNMALKLPCYKLAEIKFTK
jgi:hypothetical protein